MLVGAIVFGYVVVTTILEREWPVVSSVFMFVFVLCLFTRRKAVREVAAQVEECSSVGSAGGRGRS